MNHSEYSEFRRKELVKTIENLLSNNFDFIANIRKIVDLRYEINEQSNELFYFFIGIDSETQHFPTEANKHNYSDSQLHKINNELYEYLSIIKNDLISASEKLRDFLIKQA